MTVKGWGEVVLLAVALLLLLWGEGHFTRNHIQRQHDDQLGVTCWVYVAHGISCIPDAAVRGLPNFGGRP